jgi:translation initiation factor 2 subunit 2
MALPSSIIMPGDDYHALLKRARDQLPDKVTKVSRFDIPEVDVLYEGKTTVWRNFGEVADTLRREHMHFFQYMLRELGTSGNIGGRRVMFKGRVVKKNIEDKLESFLEAFVYCQECRSPDTRLVREGRTTVLRCDACGGHRPVAVRKAKRASREQHSLQEGKVYDVLIEDIGKKGDGVAKLGNYTVFVTGAPKGAEMKILIEKVTGSIAYARPHVE